MVNRKIEWKKMNKTASKDEVQIEFYNQNTD